MAFIRMVDEDEATGQVATDYAFISRVYSEATKLFLAEATEQVRVPVSDVFRASSIVPPYGHFTAFQLSLITDEGRDYLGTNAIVPRLVPAFATAMRSSCFF